MHTPKVHTLILTTLLGVTVCAVGEAKAKGKAKLPKITGGGVAQNLNAGPGFPDTFTHLGFNAQATDDGILLSILVGDDPNFFLDIFGVDPTVYPAKGQVQLKNQNVDTGDIESKIHGSVVCIANLGPSGMIDGDQPGDGADADPLGDVWEIRFEITKAEAQGEKLELPDFPIYGSIYVQDGGKDDFMDENFAAELLPVGECGINPFFGLEPLIHGNITVHQ